MARAGTIEVDIRANSAQFVREMRRVRRSTEGVQKQLRSFARGAAGAFAAVFSAQTIRNVIRVADELENFSNRIGVNAQELQAWQQVAAQFNVQQNQLNIGLQRLQRRSAEAAIGTGEAQGALRELGIDAARFSRLSLDNQILDLAQAFEGVASDAAKTRLAFKLFDSEGVVFLQFLKEGEDGLRALRNEVTTWSDETREALAEANTEITILANNFTILAGNVLGFIRGAGGDLLDYLREVEVSPGLSLLTSFATGFGAAGSQRGVAGIGVLAAPTLPSLGLDMGGAGVRLPDGRESALGQAPDNRPATGGLFTGPLEAINQANEAVKEALRQAEAAGQNAIIENNRFRIEQEKRVLEEQKRLRKQATDQFVNLFQQNLVQAADGSFKEILNGWILTLQQMVAAAAASRIFDLFSGTGFGQAIGNFFGGARANGGPVMAGGAYLVGERGPEIFTPNRSGQIIPNGGGTIVQNITVNGGNRGELVAAMAVAKNAAVREVEDARRRR